MQYRRVPNKSYCTLSKNVTTLSRYNSDIRDSILIMFGVNVTENRQSSKAKYSGIFGTVQY